MHALHAMRDDLRRLDAADRLRALAPRGGIDFTSNDYLGLAASPRLTAAARDALDRGVPVGAAGSRLLRGNTAEHEALETEAARLFGGEAALFVASGYGANTLLLATLPGRGDLVVHDALIHASVHEGMRLGRAECVAFPHNDVDAADRAIAAWRGCGGVGAVWIAAESLYSMDGDRAPLADLAALAERHDAMLLLDEAHATGVYGPDGRGLAAAIGRRDTLVTLHTCGKALGCEGALIVGPRLVRDTLVNRGRGFVFSTAPSPLMAAVAREALRILVDEPQRRHRLAALVDHAGAAFARLGIAPTGSPIQPVIVGADARAMAIAAALRADGFDVRGIRPPTVAEGSARLRLALTLNIDPDAVTDLAAALARHL